MELMRHVTALLGVLMLGVLPSSADEAADYKIFADETREAVYSMDLPAFDVREIPARYRDESAVYVAVYNELDARKKTGSVICPAHSVSRARPVSKAANSIVSLFMSMTKPLSKNSRSSTSRPT